MKSIRSLMFYILVSVSCVYPAASSYHLTGSIGKSNVQMHLIITGNDTISGEYFYTKHWTTISIKGTYSVSTKKITITEDVSNGIMELTGPDANGNIKGFWSEKSKRFPVALTIVASYRTIEQVGREQREEDAVIYEQYYYYPELAERFPNAKELNRKLRAVATGLPDSFELKNEPDSKTETIDYDDYPIGSTSESDIAKINYIDDHLLILKTESYSNQVGAAHPTSSDRVGIYEINGRILKQIGLTDILKDSCYIDTIIEMLNSEIDSDNGTDCIFEKNERNHFGALSNFYPTPKGCLFLYNIYEAAPYACGPLAITLPWSSLSRFIINDSPISHLHPKLHNATGTAKSPVVMPDRGDKAVSGTHAENSGKQDTSYDNNGIKKPMKMCFMFNAYDMNNVPHVFLYCGTTGDWTLSTCPPAAAQGLMQPLIDGRIKPGDGWWGGAPIEIKATNSMTEKNAFIKGIPRVFGKCDCFTE